MEGVSLKPEFGHLPVGNLDAWRICVRIQIAFYRRTVFRCSSRNEIDDDLMTDQSLAPPVLGDEGELDLVPLAGARREVADRV